MTDEVLAGGWVKAFGDDRKQFTLFFDKMLDGFAYHKIIVDKSGKPIDYVFLEVNSAFERMTGLRRERVVGKKVTEVLLGIEKDPSDWIGIYGKVALTGESVQFENFNEALGKWFKVSAYCSEKGYFGTLFEDITENKRAGDALRLSEERFSKAFNLSPFAVIMTRLSDGKYVDVNDTFLKMFEFTRDEVIGHTANEIKIYAKPDGRAAYLVAFKKGYVSDFEIDLKTKSGKPLKALGFAEIININGEDLTFGTLIDITERKKAEEELKRSEEYARQRAEELRKLMDIIPAAVWVSRDPECKVIVGNQAANTFYEAVGEENVSAGPASGNAQDTTRRFFRNGKELTPQELPMQEAAAKNVDIKNSELEVAVPSGRKITILGNAKPLLDEAGKVRGCLGAFVDITERKKAEEATARQAELIDLSPDAIIVRKLDGTITFWSKGAEKLYGWSKNEAVGQVTHVLLKTEFPEPLEEILKKLKLTGKWSGVIGHICKNCDKVFVQSHWLGKFNDQGEIVEMLESNVDITERIRMQAKLEESAIIVEEYANQMEELANKRAEQLKEAERLAAIGATAGMVGHDIRNPLQAITGDVYLAKMELASTPESEEKKNALESLCEIEKNVTYINKIVADLQDFAKPLNPRAEETDLKLIVDELIAKNELPEKVKVSVNMESEAATVVADSTFLNRIMYNLVNNAVQAMPNGGQLTIHAYKDKKNHDYIITVKDTGVGIPESVKNKLFTPMFTTKAKGQGFGLAVIKRMTEALGGKVTFESQEGKGTKFIVRLPPHQRAKKEKGLR